MQVYKHKNGRISEISEIISICSFCRFDVPNFFQSCEPYFFNLMWLLVGTGSTGSRQKPPSFRTADPTETVRGPDTTVAVQDKYARMLVLQGHCPLVFLHLLPLSTSDDDVPVVVATKCPFDVEEHLDDYCSVAKRMITKLTVGIKLDLAKFNGTRMKEVPSEIVNLNVGVAIFITTRARHSLPVP